MDTAMPTNSSEGERRSYPTSSVATSNENNTMELPSSLNIPCTGAITTLTTKARISAIEGRAAERSVEESNSNTDSGKSPVTSPNRSAAVSVNSSAENDIGFIVRLENTTLLAEAPLQPLRTGTPAAVEVPNQPTMSARQLKRKQEAESWIMFRDPIIEGSRRTRGGSVIPTSQVSDYGTCKKAKTSPMATKEVSTSSNIDCENKNTTALAATKRSTPPREMKEAKKMIKKLVSTSENKSTSEYKKVSSTKQKPRNSRRQNKKKEKRQWTPPKWVFFERREDWGEIPAQVIESLYDPKYDTTQVAPESQRERPLSLCNLPSVWGAPGVEANPKFNGHEEEIFLEQYLRNPKNFSKITTHLPGRTSDDCRDHYYLMKGELKLKLRLKVFQRKEQKRRQGELKNLPILPRGKRLRKPTERYGGEADNIRAPLFIDNPGVTVKLPSSYYDLDGGLTDDETP